MILLRLVPSLLLCVVLLSVRIRSKALMGSKLWQLKVFQKRMPKTMGLGSERQVKIDYIGKALEVLNLKGHKITRLA